jgi:hypothetical protein
MLSENALPLMIILAITLESLSDVLSQIDSYGEIFVMVR